MTKDEIMLPFIALFLSIILTTFNRGFFSLAALAILVSLTLLLIYLFGKQKTIYDKNSSSLLVSFLLIITYTLFLFHSGGIYQKEITSSYFLLFLPVFSYPLILTYAIPFQNLGKREKLFRLIFFLGLALVLRLLIIIASPNPTIDVYTLLKEAPQKLFSGENPYDTFYSFVYPGMVTDYYPYWPTSFLLETPFIFFLNDPRILLTLAEVVSGLLLFYLGKKKPIAEMLSLIYLFRPNSIFIIEQSWLTPLAFLLVILTFFLWEKKKELLLGLVLGTLTGLQPIYAVFLPFFLFLSRRKTKLILVFFAILGAIVLPFFLLNPQKFLEKTIFVYFKNPSETPTIPVYLSLNLNTVFYLTTGGNLPFFVSFLGLFFITFFIFYRLIRSHPINTSEIILALAVFFFSFYLFFRQAFINYYYFASGLLILWLVKVFTFI